MKQIVCQFPPIRFENETFENLFENSDLQSKANEAKHNIIIQVPPITDLNISSSEISPRSNYLLNTSRHFKLCCQRFNTPCSENTSPKHPRLAADEKTIKLEDRRQQNLIAQKTAAEITVALGLWRRIHKMHQQIESIQRAHEKRERVREIRQCHTQRSWENILRRGKRIALLQKQRNREKMQLDRRKMERIKAQNEQNEKLKSNRERIRTIGNYHKQIRKNYQLTQNQMNHEKRLSERKTYIREKSEELLNLQTRTREIRSRLNHASESVKQQQHQLATEIQWNQICDKLNIENHLQERRTKEMAKIVEHTKQLRNQKLVKIPILVKLTNLTLNDKS
ncbi:unnamed protein product [Trichobilharzia szidati]|nr:unnamed protein product [Trichobilharzia szidati]